MQNGVSATSTDSSYLYSNRVVVARLPTKCSRHNTTSRAHAITKVVKNTCFSSSGFEKAETKGDKIENLLVRTANHIICKIILILYVPYSIKQTFTDICLYFIDRL